jgi:hypothetical protein
MSGHHESCPQSVAISEPLHIFHELLDCLARIGQAPYTALRTNTEKDSRHFCSPTSLKLMSRVWIYMSGDKGRGGGDLLGTTYAHTQSYLLLHRSQKKLFSYGCYKERVTLSVVFLNISRYPYYRRN